MAYEIEWTLNATEDLYSILEYLQVKWSLVVTDNFLKILDKKIELLSNYPLVGRPVEYDETIRKILITKHNLLYYKIDNNKIILLDFFDTRQNPTKNFFE